MKEEYSGAFSTESNLRADGCKLLDAVDARVSLDPEWSNSESLERMSVAEKQLRLLSPIELLSWLKNCIHNRCIAEDVKYFEKMFETATDDFLAVQRTTFWYALERIYWQDDNHVPDDHNLFETVRYYVMYSPEFAGRRNRRVLLNLMVDTDIETLLVQMGVAAPKGSIFAFRVWYLHERLYWHRWNFMKSVRKAIEDFAVFMHHIRPARDNCK